MILSFSTNTKPVILDRPQDADPSLCVRLCETDRDVWSSWHLQSRWEIITINTSTVVSKICVLCGKVRLWGQVTLGRRLAPWALEWGRWHPPCGDGRLSDKWFKQPVRHQALRGTPASFSSNPKEQQRAHRRDSIWTVSKDKQDFQ